MSVSAIREDVRDGILDAADTLYRRYGYRKTTVEDIAQAARVCRATIYLYFRNKEEIALSWIVRFHESLMEKMRRIALSDELPLVRLQNLLMTRVMSRFDVAQNYTESIDELFALLRTPLLAQREACQEQEALLIAEVLRDGANQGVFTAEDALQMAHLVILATNSLLPYSLSARQLGERQEIETKTSGLISLLLRGLTPGSPNT